MVLPSDSASLLVPIALDAWVVDSQNEKDVSQYRINYERLKKFIPPSDPPFAPSARGAQRGIHLHWALPDGLTRARQESKDSDAFTFPYVPNRWLVVRTQTKDNQWRMKAWVVQSDFLPASGEKGSSSFLNPHKPSELSADGEATVNFTTLGKSYTVEAWETRREPGTEKYFLQAVGPGNISFAAYQPFSKNVFSFVNEEADLPNDGTGLYDFTYMVVGWYAASAPVDPLAGVATFRPGLWQDEAEWASQSPAERFATILGALGWRVEGPLPAVLPTASLYHGLVASVKRPYSESDVTKPRPEETQVAVGNTAPDALAALIQNYARQRAQAHPKEADAWVTAGNTLGNLLQASMLELLDDYDQPGGGALVAQQIEQSWFGSDPGGTVWQVAAREDTTDEPAPPLTLAQQAALDQQLAQLNADQLAYDKSQRHLQARQAQLYRTWLNLSQGKKDDPETTPDFEEILLPVLKDHLYPDLANEVQGQLAAQAAAWRRLPHPAETGQPAQWAEHNWQFPGAQGFVGLQALGRQLKASTAPRFWHPTDPVVLICGARRARRHGEDGRFSADRTLACRLPGQTITGLQAGGQPAIAAPAVAGQMAEVLSALVKKENPQLPALTGLLTELFFSDPGTAGLMASAVPGSRQEALTAAMEALLAGQEGAQWLGTAPSPVAFHKWQQAWAPLFLEWEATYYPTVAGEEGAFSIAPWQFDGTQYTWDGTGVRTDNISGRSLSIKGRAVVTPYAQDVWQDKLNKYLGSHTAADRPRLQQLLDQILALDILAQRLSGFTDRLLTLQSQETFPPPAPRSAGAGPTAHGPDLGALVQEQYHLTSVLRNETGGEQDSFLPIRGGVVTFSKRGLQLVDTFGQVLRLTEPNTPQGFEPLISPALQPPPGTTVRGISPFVLGPRLVQSTRLDLTLLARDGRQAVQTSPDPNPICGWLLPNHLNDSLAVYDGAGTPLGELLPLPAPGNWRPQPAPAGNPPAPARPEAIANAALREVVLALARQPTAGFRDFLSVVDKTLWTVDPLGGRDDAFLSTLIGRPLAVVQLGLSLAQHGEAATSQLWNSLLTADSTPDDYHLQHDTGGVERVPFPVRLGSAALRNDGLLGYFLPEGAHPYATFYTTHSRPQAGAFIKPILRPQAAGTSFQGDVALRAGGPGATVTMLLDPRGVVHGYTGVLPVQTVALPSHLVEEFLRKLRVTFQTGPLLADPGPLRTMQPAEKQGTWTWLQQLGATLDQSPLVEASAEARFPSQPAELREGWLQLSDFHDEH